MHPSCLSLEELASQCRWTFARRSGPGGQHRNKVETAATVEHLPTGITAEANERRSQSDNRRIALWRLRVVLALAERCEPPTRPGPQWHAHRRGTRLEVSADHDDLPAMIAEAFDHLATHDWLVAATAEWLGVSTTQLVRLVARLPAALAIVNRHRGQRGAPPLRG